MLYIPNSFDAKEKLASLKALVYMLNINKKHNKNKYEYFLMQIKAIGIAESKYEECKNNCAYSDVVKSLKSLDSIRTQRYIIREMIMLAISGYNISDEDIRVIYKIAEDIGVSSEKVGDFFIWAAKGIEWRIEGAQLVEEDL